MKNSCSRSDYIKRHVLYWKTILGRNCNRNLRLQYRFDFTLTIRFSPTSTLPAGKYHVPAQELLASCIISTSLRSFINTVTTMYDTPLCRIGLKSGEYMESNPWLTAKEKEINIITDNVINFQFL